MALYVIMFAAVVIGAMLALVYAAIRHDQALEAERQRMMRSCRLVTVALQADGYGVDVVVARMVCVN